MAPKGTGKSKCQICENAEWKYKCSSCFVMYCSVSCYKEHKNSSCRNLNSNRSEAGSSKLQNSDNAEELETRRFQSSNEDLLEESKPLRPLTSLKWPYVPEEPSYVDPFAKNDPKPLYLKDYEAIATSPTIRRVLASHERLPELLRSLDELQGRTREEEIERVLGVSSASSTPHNKSGGRGRQVREGKVAVDEDDMRALRRLAEAVDAAVRVDGRNLTGVEWEDI